MRFKTVDCEKGDTVRVASILMEVIPGFFVVTKKGRNTVFLVSKSAPEMPSTPWHKSRVIEVVKEETEAAPAPQTKRRGRPPKPRPAEAHFVLGDYLKTFGRGVELWIRPGKRTSANIIIDAERKHFWYFRTDPKTKRPKQKFYGSIPIRIGRKFHLADYHKKITMLSNKGYALYIP